MTRPRSWKQIRDFTTLFRGLLKTRCSGYLVDALADILDGTMLGIDYPAHRRTAILRAHRSILDALERKDPDAAEDTMARHIAEDVRYAERKFPEVRTRRVVWNL